MRCPWTGKTFPAVKRGANAKVFATDAARAEAHKAARLYTLAMIEQGLLSWEQIRRWYDAERKGDRAPYTTQPGQANGAEAH